MSLQIENLGVLYGATRALDGVSIDLQPGEMFFLLGPSGCGKSTLLRCVAGFIEDFTGEIRFGGQSLQGVPPHKRDFGMVFQNYALFPHMTVGGNVAFGLEARRVPAAERDKRVAEALDMAGLSGFERRRPGELSGGQQQRVALARALVIRPRALLLDEPLSNLDARLRWEMREEIRRIHKATRITTLYVTHDQNEALSLADRMAILKAGKVDALGTPRELYRRPPTRFSAEFLGDINALNGTLQGDGVSVATPLGTFRSDDSENHERIPPGTAVTLFCRPEDTLMLKPGGAFPHGAQEVQANASVLSSAFLGEVTLYKVALPGLDPWHVRIREGSESTFEEGEQVRVAVRRWSVRNWKDVR